MADNRCVCCGGIIPEGLMACPNCLVASKKEMTVKQAFDSIVEDGIALGAGDFVDPEALEVAAVIMAKFLRGLLVEVVHGEWIMVIDENDCECIECPLCGEQFYDGDNDTFDKPYNYCPNCGADMRERRTK